MTAVPDIATLVTAALDLATRQWHFTIPDAPVAAGRPRVAVRGGRPHGYVPAKTAQAAWRIREHVAAELGPAWTPLGGPVALAVVVYVPMPASIPKRERLTARPERRPDLDNYVKTAMDGLSPLWLDDAQVVELHAEKRYAVDQSPRWEIAVEALGSRARRTLMPNDIAYAIVGTLTKSRVDDDGVLTFEASKATGPDLDGDGQRVDMGWAVPAMREWFATGGNLREQHDAKRAIGRALTLEERADGVYISGRVVDPVTVAKVSEGVLQYISIGVKGHKIDFTQKALAPNGLINGGRIVECSLVDRGSNPTAKLVLAKAEGPDDHLEVGGELVKFDSVVRQRPPRKVQPRKVAKPAPVPLAKAVEPDLAKVDLLDDASPLASLIKSVQADPVVGRILRRSLDQPTALEQRVAEYEAEIGKVLAFVEPQSHFRRRKNGNSVHLTPPLPQRSARHYSPDDQLTKAAAADNDDLTKAIQSDPRRDTRVATIRRLLGVDAAYERARTQKLEARIATLRSDISKAMMIGRAVPRPNDQSANHN